MHALTERELRAELDRVRGELESLKAELARRLASSSSPASVVLVAEEISTSVMSPGAATPSKFTVLLWRVRPRSLEGSVREGPSTSTSIVRPTKRWARSVACRCTASTSRPMRSLATSCGIWPGSVAASVSRRGE